MRSRVGVNVFLEISGDGGEEEEAGAGLRVSKRAGWISAC